MRASPLASIAGSSHYNVRVKDHVLAPLLYRQLTFHDKNYINRDEATLQVFTSQTNSVHRHDCHVTSIQCQQPLSRCAEAKQASFHAKKKTKLLHSCKMSKSSHNTCKHYKMFLCLSHSVLYPKCLFAPPSKHFL